MEPLYFRDLIVSAMIAGKDELAHAMIQKGLDVFTRPLQQLVNEIPQADYFLLVAALRCTADALESVMTPSQKSLTKHLREKIETVTMVGTEDKPG